MLTDFLYNFLPIFISFADDADQNALKEVVGGFVSDTTPFTVYSIFEKPFDGILSNKIITNVYGAVAVIGILFMLVYFCVNLVDDVIKENLDTKIIVTHLVKFFIGCIIVFNIGSFLLNANEAVISITEEINTKACQLGGARDQRLGIFLPDYTKFMPLSYYSVDGKKMVGRLQDTFPFGADFNEFLVMTFANLLSNGCVVVLFLLSLGRALNFALYYMLSPLLVADAFSRGINGIATKIKIVIAILLQVPATIAVLYLCDIVVYSMFQRSNGMLIYSTAIAIVLWGVFKGLISVKKTLQRIMA